MVPVHMLLNQINLLEALRRVQKPFEQLEIYSCQLVVTVTQHQDNTYNNPVSALDVREQCPFLARHLG